MNFPALCSGRGDSQAERSPARALCLTHLGVHCLTYICTLYNTAVDFCIADIHYLFNEEAIFQF